MSYTLEEEIKKRRTFGIISHPDAGKTTLTEKLLLFGGAIQVAGTIKARKASRHATSDFLEIERQRGISVTTSVMGFEYKNFKINLLDTPGHADFCEDTYRTLTAVDSAIMVIDSSKGVQSQTLKLLEVCRMRNTPIITFMNKCDREGIEPFDLLDDVEKNLKLPVCPMTWPIGMGKAFQGVYHIANKSLLLFKAHQSKLPEPIHVDSLETSELREKLGPSAHDQLIADIEMIEGIYPAFNLEDYLAAKITPLFFGSALNNFGVKELLDYFLNVAPPPLSRDSTQGEIKPNQNKFSGFIFKIHANIDPKHRDRIAFLRVCSGKFERNKKYLHVRLKKPYKSHNPTAFMAQNKDVIDEAYPGDIIGLHDTGNLAIGDTISENELFFFKGIPSFSPELFRIVINDEPMKSKQLLKGLDQLCEEGVAQLFTRHIDGRKLLGTVGALQFDVIQYRLEHEYKAKCRYETASFCKACWLSSNEASILKRFISQNSRNIAYDKQNNPVYLAQTTWALEREIKENPTITFLNTCETS